MPQQCRVCSHPERAAIDAELLREWERSLRAIGAEFGLSKDALFRHAQRHLPNGDEDSPIAPDSILNNQNESDEPRQGDENSAHEKKDDPPAADEARYQAFIERWRERRGVWRYELEGEEELIETAVNRGDLFAFGAVYVRSAQAASRLTEKC
jgi:hypothetical protein